jgi:peptidyl-dipeptidase A
MLLTLVVFVLGLPCVVHADAAKTARARKFLETHTQKVRPLEIAVNLAWWNANTTGKDSDFEAKKKAQNELDKALSDSAAFKDVKDIREAGGIDDPVLARAVEIVYLAYLEKQVDPELLKKMVELSNNVEQKFNAFRAQVDGKEMTENDVRKVLKESKDSERRRAVWAASKAVGKVLEADLKDLVKLRNQAAAKLGFKNYHAMALFLSEQDGDQIIKLFDELDDLTREPFRRAKSEIDAKLAADCGIPVDELRPWHYHDPFFQETPAVFGTDIDVPFQKTDLKQLCREFYAGIGLPIDRVLERSDLFERPGKSPHAFCTDIDREGDVRVLANIVPNAYWASTMLHELGHAVYSTHDSNVPAKLPYVLRSDAHILATEGVAMMFERMSKKRSWLEKMGVALADPKAFEDTASKMLRYQLLIFSRWCQVMLRFEKSMYENPDQDLNKLWWDLVEKYQMVKRPPERSAPDYASKIHVVSAPVYYHNYMMGELFASQVHHAIARDVYKSADPVTVIYVGNPEVGKFMRERVFGPGKTLKWNALTKHATGAELNAKAFAADFK